jgi:aspartate kinase
MQQKRKGRPRASPRATSSDERAPVILKFGGAALERPDRVAEIIRGERAEGQLPVVVASARAGVTDDLIRARGFHSSIEIQFLVRAIEERHPGTGSNGERLGARLTRALLEASAQGAEDRRSRDHLLSFGERFASLWLTGELRGHGIPATAFEADEIGLITDTNYGDARILLDRSTAQVRSRLSSSLDRGRVPVVTGFFGVSTEGRVALLGRSGSDYSATALGAMMGAGRVDLVKGHASIFTADPHLVRAAQPIARLTYDDAEELAQFGAGVLHHRTIEAVRSEGIPIRVLSLEHPTEITTIGPGEAPSKVRALSLLEPLRLIRIRVPGGRDRPGVVADVTQRLARAPVNLVQLFTSSALLCILVQPEEATRALEALRPLAAAEAARLEGPLPVSLVTAIGPGILGSVGHLPDGLLARAEGFSATPRAISLAVPTARGIDTLRDLHRALVGSGDA